MQRETVKKAPRIACIVSHTHWDREWYLTFHEFRVNLVQVVRQVLDALESDDALRHFVLDGQALLLEDYLEICPEDEPRLRRLIQDGALAVGPWYILPDEFLVSGEATVRNLLLGHQVAGRFGPVQRVGYMPDSFGHIAQLPQILRQAGIDSFIYTRGNGDEIAELGHEFLWQAPDGSEVLAINQCGGYCNAGGLGFDEIWHAHTQREVNPERAIEQVRELFERMAELSNGDIYLLNNGCDHFPPQRGFGALLDTLRGAFPDTEFNSTDLASYVREVRSAGFARQTFTGEMISGRLHHILSGVWSSRMPLKQQNHACQTLLERCVEPLATYSHFQCGQEYPAGLIRSAWKLLLQNHPHDSICGCSTDEVHRDMEPRFTGVLQTGEQLLRRAMQRLAPTFARRAEEDRETSICVANPLPVERTAIVDRLVVLQPSGADIDSLQLVDEEGRGVPFQIIERQRVERFWGIDYRTELYGNRQWSRFQNYVEHFGARMLRPEEDGSPVAEEGETTVTEESRATVAVEGEAPVDHFLLLQFQARDLPALGHANFHLRERSSTSSEEPESERSGVVSVSGNRVENGYLAVHLHQNGTFDVLDRASGHTHRGLNRLSDTEDIGDEYDFAPCAHTATVTASWAKGTVRVVEETPWRVVLETEYVLRLPAAIADDRRRRVARNVDCRVITQVCLEHDSRVVQVNTLFDNLARDHRLRATFPTSIISDHLISDGQFCLNRRSIEQPAGESWVQPPTGTWPQQEFSLVEDGRLGLAILNQGLPEIAAERDDAGHVVLSLTLLRAVEWLSRDDFDTRRRSNAGPTLHTPDAQCLGSHLFQYAVVPFSGDPIEANIKGLSAIYRTPVIAVQGVPDGAVTGGQSFLSQATSRAAISAIKQHEERNTVVVRLYNLTAESVEETLTFGQTIRGAWSLNLLEERQETLGEVDGNRVHLALGPHAIAGIEVDLTGHEAS